MADAALSEDEESDTRYQIELGGCAGMADIVLQSNGRLSVCCVAGTFSMDAEGTLKTSNIPRKKTNMMMQAMLINMLSKNKELQARVQAYGDMADALSKTLHDHGHEHYDSHDYTRY